MDAGWLWTAAGGCGAAAGGLLAWGARSRSACLFAPSVWQGPRGRHSIALTFDDGPTPGTRELLEILDRYRVKATFFQCGVQVRRQPDIAREVVAADHEIGNHTDTHRLLALHSPRTMFEELSRAQESIRDITGCEPRLFRAPYGVRWFGLRAVQRRLNLLGVMWSTIGRDWVLNGDGVRRRLMAGARPGAIFCLHDGRMTASEPDISTTLVAVRQILPALLDQGYRFETVSQLLCPTI